MHKAFNVFLLLARTKKFKNLHIIIIDLRNKSTKKAITMQKLFFYFR